MFYDSYIDWYAVVAASPILARMLTWSLSNAISQYYGRNIIDLARSRRLAPLFARSWHLPPLYRRTIILPNLVVIANVVALILNVKDIREVASRSGIVATVNLALLLAGAHLDVIAAIQGDSLRSQIDIHRCLSSATLLTATLHVLLVVTGGKVPLATPAIWGFTACLSLAVAALVSQMRRHFYEAFLLTHLWATAFTAMALLKHLAVQRATSRLYILIGIIFWFVIFAVSSIAGFLRNIQLGPGNWLPKVSVQKVYRTANDDQIVLTDAYHIHLWVSRPFNVRPGQYLYLTIPWLGLPFLWQSHPFWIVWWELEPNRNSMHLQMLVRPRHGFTSRLLPYRDKQYSAWIRGPYGQSKDLARFETVLMFATDIGIAAHLPYLKCLLDGSRESSVRTRRVMVVWEIRDDSHDKWIRSWFDHLLRDNTSNMLEIRIHYPGGRRLRYTRGGGESRTLSDGNVIPEAVQKRLKLFSQSAKFEQVFTKEIARHERGSLMLSVCMDQKSRQGLQELIRRIGNGGFELMEHDYQVPD